MSREVPFKTDKICDGCGALGAYDFYGDYLCVACTDAAFASMEDDEPPSESEDDDHD